MDVTTEREIPQSEAAWFRGVELSALLRSCRRRVANPERRTEPGSRPGLTQEQAAKRLGVSKRYYQNLEHARLRRAEPDLLEAAARELELTALEREVFYHLAAGHAAARRRTQANLAATQELIDAVPGQPTLVTDLAWNMLAWNRDAPLMLGDPAQLPDKERNAILWLLSRDARQIFVDIEKEYPLLVGQVRTAYLCARCADAALNHLVERLLLIPEAAYWWQSRALHPEPAIQTLRVRRPDGTIRQVRSISVPIPHQGLRLIVFTPVGAPPGSAPLP
jgi:transcriptional regulator with XRE-family HTH domain